jgi:hypothetical protein
LEQSRHRRVALTGTTKTPVKINQVARRDSGIWPQEESGKKC